MNSEIKDFVFKHYGLRTNGVTRLAGFGGENYKIEATSGVFVLKFYEPGEGQYVKELLEAENLFLYRLTRDSAGVFPVPQQTLDGNDLSFSESKKKYFRLLTFLDGDLFADVEHTPELLESYGSAVGEMNSKSSDFRHIATESRTFEWDLRQFELNRKCLPLIENLADRKLVEYYFLQNLENVSPKLGQLRKGVIHGDVNSRNVVAKNGEIAGIFDFGDINFTPLDQRAFDRTRLWSVWQRRSA